MINVHLPDSRRPPPPSSAFSFLSRGWREVRDSADADLRLIKDRARELENLIHKSTSLNTFTKNNNNNQNHNSTNSPGSVDFVQRLTRAYSSPDFKGWAPRGKIGIDLSAIRSAMEVEGVREFRLWEGEERVFDWEPIKKSLKKGFEGFDRKIDTSELLQSIKNSEFVGKVKSSLKNIDCEILLYSVALNSELELPYVKTRKAVYKDLGEPQEVPPLDVPELLAHLVRQSGPFLDQLGVKRDLSDKLVESLCSKRKNQLLSRSLSSGDTTVLENDCISDELDLRIASVLQSTGHHYEGGFWTDHPKQDLSDGKRSVAIVTTASLPWMTGTAVNPLFRAAYLSKSEEQNVTLLIPWLCRPDQELVYPNNLTFSSPEEQEVYIRKWLEERVGFKTNFKISFYPGKFSKGRRSIIPAGDTSQFIPTKDADIAILEEPEHLNWYHHGRRWTDKFNHVVGIVHTNYLEYIKREKNGDLQAFFVKHINNWVTRAYCDKVLRLSAATQDLPKSIICNVHGVNPKFLEIGEKVAADRVSGQQSFTKGAYFLGKLVWAKGYRELIDILDKHKSDLTGFNVDVFGNGEDAHEVQSTAKRLDLSLNFMKGRDHADDSLHGYKVFINPSVSDVLCTATAEALAMGKFVVCADHPSNEFFRSFPNCLTYKTPEDFVAKVKEAMANEPEPLSPEERYNLSWEAANERFMEYSELNKFLNGAKNNSSSGKDNGKFVRKSSSMPNLAGIVDGGLAFAHYCFTGSEILRLSSGGIPGTREYDNQFCKDLHLLPPQVENPIYGW